MPEIAETLVIGVDLPEDQYWLGLFVVLALVRSLGGGLRAVSDGPGRGTTVHVVLPDASPEAN